MPKASLPITFLKGLAAGATASAELIIGHRYHDLKLHFPDGLLQHMTEIRIYANSEVIHRYSGAERNSMNMHDGLADAETANILVIPFDRKGLLDRGMMEQTALNTGSQNEQTGEVIDSAHIEIDIAGAATVNAGDKIEIKAGVSERLPGGPGAILRILKTTAQAAGAGDLHIENLPHDSYDAQAVNREWFKSAGVNRVILERNTKKYWDRTKAENTAILTDNKKVPQAGWFVLDTTEEGYGLDMIDTRGFQNFRYTLDMAGAENLTIITERMGRLGR